MSIESLAIALHHSRAKGMTKLVLIGIANHDGDGGAWPAVSTLMKYCGPGTSRRTVQDAVNRLEELGEVKRIVQRGGTTDSHYSDWHRPNLYRFVLRCPMDCDHTSSHRTKRDTFVPEFVVPELPGAEIAPGGGGAEIAPPSSESAPGGLQNLRPNHPSTPNHVEEEPHVGNRARERAESERQSRTPSDDAFDVVASLRSVLGLDDLCSAFAARRRIQHQYSPANGRCVHCGERNTRDEFEGVAFDQQTGEVQ
ncbi:helix-turn-helix domain-containing protein [Rathayibacter sp. AY1A7]|uniref:helix-turn-helix domain-containing protein n=1 Tax=Rathayibacter sp. AY1A7 TaxID=2080524 RepID=UPI000CE927E6|nr:helix-turn-helix domain-containing protein [Rathayibacter sp. AY1A7]PPF21017.1 hypothetical protein C5B95_06290 [Rathayibacter sp. AY1A7]